MKISKINNNPRTGIIYVMTDSVYGQNGYVKVGFTGRDFRVRLSEANVWNPKKDVYAVFAKSVNRPREVETKVLKALRDKQFGVLRGGEWFKGDISEIVATTHEVLANH